MVVISINLVLNCSNYKYIYIENMLSNAKVWYLAVYY